MATARTFEDLEVYQKACEFDNDLCQAFTYERFKQDLGLRSQALNSSGSCQDNIAEGFERGGNREFMNFLRIAKGSIGETRSQIRRASKRGWIGEAESELLLSKTEEISKQLGGFIKYLKNSDYKGERYAKEIEVQYGHANNLDS